MKIARVETFKFWSDWKNWMFVRLETDDGLHGWGEASLAGPLDAVESVVHEMGASLIGKDPSGVERHWQALYHTWRWRNGPIQATALSALDIALWDIEGKRLGVPVYRLLGGPYTDRIRGYASHWLYDAQTPEDAYEGAQEAVRRGFTAFKWNPLRSTDLRRNEHEGVLKAAAMMEAARDGAGPAVDIFCDMGEKLSVRTAISLANAMAPYRPGFFEEAIPYENAAAMAMLKQQICVPLATGEHFSNRWDFREIIERSAVDFLQPDVCHGGGITEVKRVAAHADTYFLMMAPHNSGGPISTLATMHLMASIPNGYILEQMEDERELRDAVSTNPVRFENGHFILPDTPGLGVDLDLDVLKDRQSRKQSPRYTTRSLWF